MWVAACRIEFHMKNMEPSFVTWRGLDDVQLVLTSALPRIFFYFIFYFYFGGWTRLLASLKDTFFSSYKGEGGRCKYALKEKQICVELPARKKEQ
jgi:hypothetical protein